MIIDTPWMPRLVPTADLGGAVAASTAEVTAGTDNAKFITPAALAGSSPTLADPVVDSITADTINGSVTIGASGPVLSSSLNSRSVAPGLCFDGSAGAGISGAGAPGTGDFAWAFSMQPTTAAIQGIVGKTTDANTLFIVWYESRLVIAGPTTTVDLATVTAPLNKTTDVVISRSSGHLSVSQNGVLVFGPVDFADNITAAPTEFGISTGAYGAFTGTLSNLRSWNRSLSAAEVVALNYGTSGADYNSASNTNLITASLTTGVGFTTSGTVSFSGSGADIAEGAYIFQANSLQGRVGRKMRVTATFTGNAHLSDYATDFPALTSGVPYDFTVTNAAAVNAVIVGDSGGCVVSAFTLVPLGLLLDNDYAGSGLTVPPRNGTSGTITLPASGVTWSVPNGNLWSFGTVAANQATIAGDALGGLTVTPKAGQSLTVAEGVTVNHATAPGVLLKEAGVNKGFIETSSGPMNLGTLAANGINFKINNATKLAIDSSGNLTASGTITTNGRAVNIQHASNPYIAYLAGAVEIGEIGTELVGTDGGKIVFHTKADGGILAARMTLLSDGTLTHGTGGNTVTLAAGAVTATGQVKNAYLALNVAGLERYEGNDTKTVSINYNGYNGGTTQFRDFELYDGKNNLVFSAVGSTKAATFAGSVAAAVAEHADNAAAVTAGLSVGTFYRTGDALKVVHA